LLARSLALAPALVLATAAPLMPLAAQVVGSPRNDALRNDALRNDALRNDALRNDALRNDGDLTRYSENQLDNLVGPIALYPDALLAQVLVAATFPDQVDDAARWVREHGTAGIDEQSWDVSVKSVAHYQSALNMMADRGDWTATLGRAYAYQSSDVMAAVQRMRGLADTQGNLMSTPQQQVVRESDNYFIVPAQPRVIYVPVYDPVLVYTRPIFGLGFSSRLWSYGVGFPIGGWLNYDLDWRRRAVYYNGWDDAYVGYGGGWRSRSRPFIQVTTIYVSPRYRNVYVNRDVAYRNVDYRNVDRYTGYHRDVYFDSRRDGYRDGYRDGRGDGRYDGRNGGRDRNPPYGVNIIRTAQPRSESGQQNGSATPDGYRNGVPQREAARDGGRDIQRESQRGESRGEARGDSPGRSAPQGQAMPYERRREPAAPPMTTRPPSNEPRTSQPRSSEPRGTQPRAPELRAPEPRASEPRSEPTRSAQPRNAGEGNRGSRERRGQ